MPAQADSAALGRLLSLQKEDTAIKQLGHRKDTLDEARELAEVSDQLAELEADLAIARKQHDDVAREQSRLEGEIELLEQKLRKEEQRMYSGAVANPKELSSLQAEVEMLKKKRATLEDSLLDAMVAKDQATATLEALQAEHEEVARRAEELGGIVREMVGDIDAELFRHQQQRDALAHEIPDDVLALYERLRAAKGGVGAAALRDGTCEGCHTKLPAKEVERLRAEGGLQRCDNCRRILVVV